ncbi:TonB-dependent receptor [Sphingomonas sp.]|uniref:TonB-dependent receptor n=1 Tax=Sphingomonas sp. TaxID=28214 RepID=UPI002DB5A2F3|nr:TonB-dependent receptor [Sphingomonas sp.]HEU4968455.1 TonB-dependent receptor [Sphingomonas sp.]
MRNHLFIGAAIAALVAPAAVQAQQITTGIEGTVTSESGTPLAGAAVTITDTRTGATRTLTTNGSGTFAATGLVTGGPYRVSASADGYEGQTVENINTTLQGNTSLSFQLSSGAGDIVVTASRANVTQLAVGPGQSFSVEVLENAPSFNRDVRDIIRIDPRVSLDRDDTGSGQDRISCLGGNDRGNAFTVDGISQGDVYGLNDTGFSSRSSTPVPYDAVRETQVAFAPFDVDYGNFTGCAINVVTKSGTNDYHFGGFFEYSDDGLRGNSVAGTPVAPVEPEKRWGAYFGGPVIKDRLFLFGAYEHQEAAFSQDDGPAGAGFPIEIEQVTVDQFNQISDVLSSVYGIETGPLVFSRPFKNDRYFVRGDLQITDQHRLEVTYQRLEEASTKLDDQASSGSFNGTVVGRNTFFLSGTRSNYYSGRLYSQWNDSFSTEVRYSRSEVRDVQDPIGGGEAQSANPIPRIVVGVDNGTGAPGAVEAGPGFSRSANDLRTDIDQLRLAGTFEAGDHRIKIGTEINHASLFNLFVQNATGTLVFRNIDDLREGLLSPGTGSSDTFNTPAGVVSGSVEGAFGNFSATGDINDAAAKFTRTIYSAFAQDEWQATDRLNLTAGVRIDWYDGGHPVLNQNFVDRYGIPNIAGFSTLDPIVMPRAAFTYDVGDFAVFSRAKLRGGVGIFSGGDPVVWFANAFQNDGRGFAEGSTQDAPCPAGQIDVVTGGKFTGVPTCFQAAGSAKAAAGTGDTQSIDPNIKQPSVVRANLGFATDVDFASSGLLSGWHVNLDYIYSHYRDPLTIVDLSQTPDIRKGLNGFTVDGRPIYAAIDPTDPDAAGCSAQLVSTFPVQWTNVTAACFNRIGRDDELMLTNSGGFDSHVASFILSKQFPTGVFTDGGSVDFSVGYAYTDAHDRRNMYNSTAGSNYDRTAAFDRQNPAESRGFYSSKHNITVNTVFREEFFEDLSTRMGITFIARSGRPYSLTFRGSGVFNDSASGSDNALVYLPTGTNDPNISPSSDMTAVQGLVDWASGYGCAKGFLGRSIPRNTCSGDWYFDMDLSISQELPGPGRLFGFRDKLKLYATMDNVLNFLDSDWNVQRRRDFSGLQDVASTSGVDAQGRYIITGFNGAQAIADDNQINFSSSVWRIKVGISYDF